MTLPKIDKAPNAPRGESAGQDWPSYRYGPSGEAQVFQRAADVPEGWADHPSAFLTKQAPAKRPAKPNKGNSVTDKIRRAEAAAKLKETANRTVVIEADDIDDSADDADED